MPHIKQTRTWWLESYKVSRKYLRKICDRLGIPPGESLTPKQVRQLEDYLGEPIKS